MRAIQNKTANSYIIEIIIYLSSFAPSDATGPVYIHLIRPAASSHAYRRMPIRHAAGGSSTRSPYGSATPYSCRGCPLHGPLREAGGGRSVRVAARTVQRTRRADRLAAGEASLFSFSLKDVERLGANRWRGGAWTQWSPIDTEAKSAGGRSLAAAAAVERPTVAGLAVKAHILVHPRSDAAADLQRRVAKACFDGG